MQPLLLHLFAGTLSQCGHHMHMPPKVKYIYVLCNLRRKSDTMIEFTQGSSLHGVQYIFESGRNLKASRVIWLGLAIAAAVLGVVWSVEVG